MDACPALLTLHALSLRVVAHLAVLRLPPLLWTAHVGMPAPCVVTVFKVYVMSRPLCRGADTLVDVLTVEEMLLYTAELKRPLRERTASKKQAVDALIQDLALTSCRGTRIGNSLQPGILGGQVSHAISHAGPCSDCSPYIA